MVVAKRAGISRQFRERPAGYSLEFKGGDYFFRQLTSIGFLSRHTARTIWLIRCTHSSVRQLVSIRGTYIVWVGRMRWAHWQPKNNIKVIGGQNKTTDNRRIYDSDI